MENHLIRALLATDHIQQLVNTPIGRVATVLLIALFLLLLMRPVQITHVNARRIHRAAKWHWLTPMRIALGIVIILFAILFSAPPVTGLAQQIEHPWAAFLLVFGLPLLPFALLRFLYVPQTPRTVARGKEVLMERKSRHRLSFHVRKHGLLTFFYRRMSPTENNIRPVAEVFQTYAPHFIAAGFHTIEFISPDITEDKARRWVEGSQDGKHHALFLDWKVTKAGPIKLSWLSWLMLVAFRFSTKAPKTMNGIVLTAPCLSTREISAHTPQTQMDV
jgi:hypothetical protein